jgi:glycosyltransferase involved in cell wall biosynthesis
MRVAWFSPVPPVRSGIAGRSAELIEALRERGLSIDVYIDAAASRSGGNVAADALAGASRKSEGGSAHDFVWRHRQRPYDLTVFQFGNSSHHDYAWPYALRYPGLVVLHDTHVHHARAALLLRERRVADYRAEFTFNHPQASPDLAEIAIAGLDSALYYEWPMVRTLVEASRLVAVHGEGARTELLQSLNHQLGTLPDQIVSIRLGEGEVLSDAAAEASRRRLRAALGFADEAIVFGIFGALTPEKRITQALAALSAVLPHAPNARLLLAGASAGHYDLRADITAHGLDDRVVVTGYLEADAEVTAHLAACDVTLNLRWPTARETSGPWLRALAAARATIITDLVHQADVPSLDPRTWTVNVVGLRDAGRGVRDTERSIREGDSVAHSTSSASTTPTSAPRTPDLGPRPADREAVCIAIDILDEDHSLRLAMRRLAADAGLRATLGRAARAWWYREHSVEAMVDDYLWAMARAVDRPVPRAELPAHLRDDGDRALRELLEPFGPDVTARIQAP